MGNYTDFQGREILVQIKKRTKNPNPKSISTVHPHTALPAIHHGDRTGFPVMVMLFGCIDGDKAIACKKRYLPGIYKRLFFGGAGMGASSTADKERKLLKNQTPW